MGVDSVVTTSAAMALAVRQLQATAEMQSAVMQQLAASQQDMAAMLAEQGIGQNIDIQV